MSSKTRVSLHLGIQLSLAIVFDTIQQLAWKVGMVAIPEDTSPWETIQAALHEPWLGLVVVLMVARLINWLKVLELADLSYAQPITTLSYVTVTILSAILLKETMTPLQIVGIGIVLAGVWCISQTQRDSHESEKVSP